MNPLRQQLIDAGAIRVRPPREGSPFFDHAARFGSAICRLDEQGRAAAAKTLAAPIAFPGAAKP